MADSNYLYELITSENDARYCAQLLAEEFSSHNVITLFDRKTSKEFFDDCSWPMMSDVLHEQLSFLVRNRLTNEIIGVILAGDLFLQHEKNLANPTAHSIPIDDLIDEMDHLFVTKDFGQVLTMNMVLHIGLCAVRFEHSGHGIANRLRQIVCDYARMERKFQYVLVQTTSQATRHIFVNKMNGKEVTIIDPTTWIWKKAKEESYCPYKDYQGGLIPNILVKL
jgi:hypothetical protein